MAVEDIKNLVHHLNDMYKAIGVLNSSLADISGYLDKDTYIQIARNIHEIDITIENIVSDVQYAYLKRV